MVAIINFYLFGLDDRNMKKQDILASGTCGPCSTHSHNSLKSSLHAHSGSNSTHELISYDVFNGVEIRKCRQPIPPSSPPPPPFIGK